MKKILLVAAIATAMTVAAFADTLSDFNDGLDTFLGEINTALPDNAVVGGTWSDAYIGQLIGIPPHFGVGIAAGVSRFPTTGFSDAMEATGTKLPIDSLILPNFGAEGRVGGFILPFDIGFRVGMMPETELSGVKVNYLHYGADVRYAVIKGNLVLPKVSVGVGYYHTDGSLSFPLQAGSLFPAIDPSFTEGKNLDLGLDFATDVFEAKAQVSKTLLIVTPYAGLGVSMALSESSYNIGDIVKASRSDTVYGARVYGGFSFNIIVLKIDTTGSYDVLSGNWGVNIGTRVQL